MAMPLVDCRIGRQTVQIAFAMHIPNPDAFAAAQHHIEWFVVVGTVLIFKLDALIGIHIILC
jgi:hypothetical protein